MTAATTLRRRPPDPALRWVLQHASAGARISSVRRLRGGTSSATHAINLREADGRLRRLVLRRFVRADWLAREPDLAAREAETLRLVATIEPPTPDLLDVDPHGTHCDVPAVLSSRLPGRLDVAPGRPASWFTRLAALLPAIHAVPASPGLRRERRYFTYVDRGSLTVPEWTREPAAWASLIGEAQRRAPSGPRSFLHRDFHPGNVLWLRGRVSGLTDWVNACYGPPGVDVGHCRVNLAVLFGVRAADRFLAAYQRLPEAAPYDPHWDCRTLVEVLPGPWSLSQWHDLGRNDLTAELQRRRLDAYAASVAVRLAAGG